jgi:hypothetical protein
MKENHLGLYVIGLIVAVVVIPSTVVSCIYGSIAEKIMVAVIGLGSSAVTGIVALMRMTGKDTSVDEPVVEKPIEPTK